MRHDDFAPRADCWLVSAAGYFSCRCGWHELGDAPCIAAFDEAQDKAVREAIEGAVDWRAAARPKADAAANAVQAKNLLLKGAAPPRFSHHNKTGE